MARIAIGGFQHETNTFARPLATFADFEKHDSWPGLTRGPALIDAVAGFNDIPINCFIAAAADRHELVALSWCSADAPSYVTEDAYERIAAMICDDLSMAEQKGTTVAA